MLANVARRQMRKKMPALQGRFEEHDALWIGAILAPIDFLDQQIDRLTEAIGEQIALLASAVELLCTITGVHSRAAEVSISEIGGDMSPFPTARHLSSWAGQCLGNDQSASNAVRAKRAPDPNGLTGRSNKTRSPRSRQRDIPAGPIPATTATARS